MSRILRSRRGFAPCLAAVALLAALSLHGPAQPRRHAAVPPPCAPLVMEGTVQRGQAFTRRFGAGLELVVEPVPAGWSVHVWPASGPRPAVDLATLASPPYHSVSPLLLTTDFGFRAQDVVGWTPRTFHYLLSSAAAAAALPAYTAVTATVHPSPAQEQALLAKLQPALEGRITILDASILPGTADASPSASAVSTHLGSVPHTVLPGSAGPLGRVQSLRLRFALQTVRQGASPCSENPGRPPMDGNGPNRGR